ncbi:hypothetical protein NFJ07_02360 [Arthrobacter sp. B2a2-09]|nr:hypothetical protein [Arthrobacter sp. B2a2-09]
MTTAEVAARAKTSETSMLYHFPTRDHILVAAMELADEESGDRLSAEALSDGEGSRDMGWVPARLAQTAMQDQATVRLFMALGAEAANPEHPAHEYMKHHNERAIKEFAAIMKRRQSEGFADPGIEPHSAARQMMAAWSGLQGQWLVDPSFDLGQEVAQVFRRLTGQPTMEVRQMIDELLTRI